MGSHSRLVALIVLCALGLGGCASDDEGTSTAGGGSAPPAAAPSATEDTVTGDDAMDAGESMDQDAMGHGGGGGSVLGEPADEGDSDRTVVVAALDEFAYDPAEVQVDAGETITFEVTNTGELIHEFVIGDAALQDEHKQEMAEMIDGGTMMMSDEPNAVSLAAGETKRITWHFTESGELMFACHQPGHFASGMVGNVEVS